MTTLTKMCIGFMAGITVGVLYAPAKGSKTRAKLNEMGGNIKEGWDSLTDTIASQLDDNEESFTQVIDEDVTFYNLSDTGGVVL